MSTLGKSSEFFIYVFFFKSVGKWDLNYSDKSPELTSVPLRALSTNQFRNILINVDTGIGWRCWSRNGFLIDFGRSDNRKSSLKTFYNVNVAQNIVMFYSVIKKNVYSVKT